MTITQTRTAATEATACEWITQVVEHIPGASLVPSDGGRYSGHEVIVTRDEAAIESSTTTSQGSAATLDTNASTSKRG